MKHDRSWLALALALASMLLLGSMCNPQPVTPAETGGAGTGGLSWVDPFTGGTQATGGDGGVNTGGTTALPPPAPVCLEETGRVLRVAREATETRVVGGTIVTLAYPWMVSIQTPSGWHYCGGTAIGPHLIVTAAHCAPETGDQVRVGALAYTTGGVVGHVLARCTHPAYDPGGAWDAALVRVDGPELPVAPLATSLTSTVHVLGWGLTSEGGQVSLQLRQVDLVVLTDAQCDTAVPFDSGGPTVCAGTKDAVGGADSCQGDSGGPGVIKDKDGWALAMIVSRGRGCARPGEWGLYTGVPGPIAEWIGDARDASW